MGQGLCDELVEVCSKGRSSGRAQWDLKGLREGGAAEKEAYQGDQHFWCEFANK